LEAESNKALAKVGFVAVVGRPSVGKSTLVNRLCKEKVAIVSSVPQTTRNAIRGIVNTSEGQLVFVDTPGRHYSEKKINKRLRDISDQVISESEIMLYVLDASRPTGLEEEEVAKHLLAFSEKTIVAINKMDSPSAHYEEYHIFLQKNLPLIPEDRIFKISAKRKEGLEPLLSALFSMAGEGEPFYPEEFYTDQELNFRISEIIREKAINRLYEELPHSIYVEVADAELRDEGKRLWVRAFIITERESQKGIVVGSGGEMIKAIRLSAQKELNKIFDWKVELDLRVKTSADWRQNDKILKKLLS